MQRGVWFKETVTPRFYRIHAFSDRPLVVLPQRASRAALGSQCTFMEVLLAVGRGTFRFSDSDGCPVTCRLLCREVGLAIQLRGRGFDELVISTRLL